MTTELIGSQHTVLGNIFNQLVFRVFPRENEMQKEIFPKLGNKLRDTLFFLMKLIFSCYKSFLLYSVHSIQI